MKENYTMQIPSGKADLYVTQSLAIFRQYGLWHDTNRVYQFVPTSLVGYVMLMKPGGLPGERPMKAWAVFRPCALSLSWSPEKTVHFLDLRISYARVLYQSYPEWWTTVKPKYGDTL